LVTGAPLIVGTLKEHTTMLLQEVIARDRMREDRRRAQQAQLVRRLAAVRRWERLASYADWRARRAAERL
jgi:hypothetical protein